MAFWKAFLATMLVLAIFGGALFALRQPAPAQESTSLAGGGSTASNASTNATANATTNATSNVTANATANETGVANLTNASAANVTSQP